MCGIIGYTGTKNNAKDIILTGLKNLEYRGYDSAGIALNQDNKINLYKESGKITNLEEMLEQKNTTSTCGIGHTRWATHGNPSKENAHPHNSGNVTLVHNGIIENYIELKDFLIQNNIKFSSDTDTEVACALINHCYNSNEKKDKLESISEACKHIRGSYAFGIIFDDEPNTIYAKRKDSPLIIGLSDSGNFIASDVSAILDHTKDYILLEQDDTAIVTKDSYQIYNNLNKPVERKIHTATWESNEYKKNGFEHFMLKEIHEQPEVVHHIFDNFIKNPDYIKNINLKNYSKIHIVACGSAMYAGLIGKYLFKKYCKLNVEVEVASEYRYNETLIDDSTLVILISQSGETADTLAALRLAKEHKAYTLAIVNVVGSTIAREADHCIYTNAGPEIAVATSKGYSSQVAILSCLSLHLANQKNYIDNVTTNKICKEMGNIKELIEQVINYTDTYKEIAKHLYTQNNVFYIGRGIDSAICTEGSLKLKEISYIHSESYAAGELKHGTISLVEDEVPVIALATDKNLIEKTISNIKETKARGAFCIFITSNEFTNISFDDFSDITLKIPTASDFIKPILITVALQLIAYYTANLKGCDIDKPRNLAKSVTVE